ncbi:hypothetical protein D3C75_1060360 [compost metagenome]
MIDDNGTGMVKGLKCFAGFGCDFMGMINMRHYIDPIFFRRVSPNDIQEILILVNTHGIEDGNFGAETDNLDMINLPQAFND